MLEIIMLFVQSINADCLYQKINENPWQSFCGTSKVLRVCEGLSFKVDLESGFLFL